MRTKKHHLTVLIKILGLISILIYFDLNFRRKVNKLCKEGQQFSRLHVCCEFDWCLFHRVTPNCRVNPMFQQKADEVSFASTDSVLNHTPILIDRCAAYRLWRVLPREFKERKELTEVLQCFLLLFNAQCSNVHRF